MSTTQSLDVKSLSLDLRNFRTVPQTDELNALLAMVSIAPDRFWALTDSLLDSGYLPTENIIVLKGPKGLLSVREGNRRIGAMKLIFGYIKDPGLAIPDLIADKIAKVSSEWRNDSKQVPCAVYETSEEPLVDRIVTLAHGKGEAAGRDKWTSVARARHNRDKNAVSEPGLDILEAYLKSGKNLTASEREIWAGVYPLTVLDEAAIRVAQRLAYASSRELANDYPTTKFRPALESMLNAIGNEALKFEHLRDKNSDFALVYGFPPIAATATASPQSTKSQSPSAAGGGSSSPLSSQSSARKTKAVSTNDPRSVMRTLRHFTPRGKGRDKVVTLLEETRLLKLDKHPHAFCFLLRAMFELSAKAYCTDHAKAGLTIQDPKTAKDKPLATVLTEITNHLTAGKPATDQFCRNLHGAMTELGKKNGLLSVTSMNQLVHNQNFVVDAPTICVVFTNVFPLLNEMNR